MYKFISLIALSFFLFILWVIYTANTGANSVFLEFVRSIPYGDKLGHMGLFGFLTLITIIALKFKSFSFGKFRVYYGIFFVGLFVVVEELSQLFIPSRNFDFADLVADFIGMIAALAICRLLSQHIQKNSPQNGTA